MSEPEWMPYVGVVTGSIGALTGIAGAVMGWIAYQRSKEMKSLDMRRELRKAVNEAEQNAREATALLPMALKSRERVSAALGLLKSGGLVAWQEQFEQDQAAVQELIGRAPTATGLEDLKPEDLEAKLNEAHKFQLELGEIVDRYKASIAEDDKHRAAIERAMLNRLEPRG